MENKAILECDRVLSSTFIFLFTFALETESILVVVARGWGEVGLGLTKGCGVSFGVDENILEIEVVLAQHCECTKFH